MDDRRTKTAATWPWVLVCVVLCAGIGWYVFHGNVSTLATQTPEAPQEQATTIAPSQTNPDASDKNSGTRNLPEQHPIPENKQNPKLPDLEHSDTAAWRALDTLTGSAPELRVVEKDHLIQRIVAFVDSLTQLSPPATPTLFKPISGALVVEKNAQGQTVIAPANAARYAPYVHLMSSIPADSIVSVYVSAYRLFQSAYKDLGYPNRHFNDRVIQVIDHLLHTPENSEPIVVVQNALGHYDFADPRLQSCSMGQKALLRLSPSQRAQVEEQLRRIRGALLHLDH